MHPTPTVSIGLPVREGAKYLAEAIDSIVAQTFPEFELVISDNASTDRTPQICRAYRHAADAFASTGRSATSAPPAISIWCSSARAGKCFKWAAHDDVIDPTYLAWCIAALEADPDAVLCPSVLAIVGGDSGRREVYDHTAFGTGRARQSDRLGAPAGAALHRGVRRDPPRCPARHGSDRGPRRGRSDPADRAGVARSLRRRAGAAIRQSRPSGALHPAQ
jgi:hypothetical protein